MRVMPRAGVARLAAIVPRINVRGAAHEEQPVERLEQIVQGQLAPDSRHDNRQRTCSIQHCREVLLGDQVISLWAQWTTIRRNPDERALYRHDGPKTP